MGVTLRYQWFTVKRFLADQRGPHPNDRVRLQPNGPIDHPPGPLLGIRVPLPGVLDGIAPLAHSLIEFELVCGPAAVAVANGALGGCGLVGGGCRVAHSAATCNACGRGVSRGLLGGRLVANPKLLSEDLLLVVYSIRPGPFEKPAKNPPRSGFVDGWALSVNPRGDQASYGCHPPILLKREPHWLEYFHGPPCVG